MPNDRNTLTDGTPVADFYSSLGINRKEGESDPFGAFYALEQQQAEQAALRRAVEQAARARAPQTQRNTGPFVPANLRQSYETFGGGPASASSTKNQARLPTGGPLQFGPRYDNVGLGPAVAGMPLDMYGPLGAVFAPANVVSSPTPMPRPASLSPRLPAAPTPLPRPVSFYAPQQNNVPPPASSYTIRSGDTLSQIAARNGTTVAALVAANGIKDPNRIIAGQTLNLGGGSVASAPRPSTPAPRTASGSSSLGSLFAPSRPAPAPRQPAGYGSKGYSDAGKQLLAMFG